MCVFVCTFINAPRVIRSRAVAIFVVRRSPPHTAITPAHAAVSRRPASSLVPRAGCWRPRAPCLPRCCPRASRARARPTKVGCRAGVGVSRAGSSRGGGEPALQCPARANSFSTHKRYRGHVSPPTLLCPCRECVCRAVVRGASAAATPTLLPTLQHLHTTACTPHAPRLRRSHCPHSPHHTPQAKVAPLQLIRPVASTTTAGPAAPPSAAPSSAAAHAVLSPSRRAESMQNVLEAVAPATGGAGAA